MFPLPDGSETGDASLFCEEWDKITEPLASVMELEVLGFGPTILVRSADENDFGVADIPVWLARRILSVCQNPL